MSINIVLGSVTRKKILDALKAIRKEGRAINSIIKNGIITEEKLQRIYLAEKRIGNEMDDVADFVKHFKHSFEYD